MPKKGLEGFCVTIEKLRMMVEIMRSKEFWILLVLH